MRTLILKFLVFTVLPLSGGEFRPGAHLGMVYANQSVNPAAGLSFGWWATPHFSLRARADASLGSPLSNHRKAEKAEWRSLALESVWHSRGGRVPGWFGGFGLSRDRYEWERVDPKLGRLSFAEDATMYHGLIGTRFNGHLWIEFRVRLAPDGMAVHQDKEVPYYTLGQLSLGWTF